MYLFKQNDELTLPRKVPVLIEENKFFEKMPSKEELPKYDDIKDFLPRPVWKNHDEHIACYNKVWELAFGNIRKGEKETGFVSDYMDTAFNGCIFMWDTSFILMFAKYADKFFKFQKTLDNFYSHQHRDGFICREIDAKTGMDRFTRFDPSSTGPDIMAWCEWEYYLLFGDKERLAEVFSPLMAYHRWMRESRTWPDGTYYSSGWGCGMDNIPRQPKGYIPEFSHGHMVWVDTCMQELYACDILIKMAKTLNRDEYVSELLEEYNHLSKLINEKLWDEETSFYYDLWNNGELNKVMHIGAYWSLLSGIVPKDRADRFIAHLENENEFKTPNRIPTLAKSHPAFEKEGDYWCGSVWAPTNYMVLKGLDRYEKTELSHKIACDYLNYVVDVFKQTGTVFENYAPFYINGVATKGKIAKKDFVGWTGLAPVAVMFEYVFGIKPDAPNNKIVWDINLKDEHGIKKYAFGNLGELDLICKARENINVEPEVILKAEFPLTLEIIWGEEGNKKRKIINN